MLRRASSVHALLAAAVAILVAVGVVGLAAPAAAQDGNTVTVQLKAENDSGVTGTAVLTADGDKTTITVDLTGAKKGYEGHVFDSTCDNHRDATVFYPIDAVDEDGHSETEIDAPLSDLTTGKFHVHMHRPAGDRGVGVACGQVPGANALPGTGVGPVGGESSSVWFLAGLVAAFGALGASFLLRRQETSRG